jgi:glycosyltransferase involved in cell wall biosynthesis
MHNPRTHYLGRVLLGLQGQNLSREKWELHLVDNAPTNRPETIAISLGTQARSNRENELEVTPARLRGIAESRGDVIVLVDDDNVLAPEYLTEAPRIGVSYPFLGAWGAGSITPKFETPPGAWAQPFLPELAVREIAEIRWSNDVNDWLATPSVTRLCVRTPVAARYRDGIR